MIRANHPATQRQKISGELNYIGICSLFEIVTVEDVVFL